MQIAAFSAAIVWLFLLMPHVNGQEVQINNIPLLFSVFLFGIMGASISAMLSIARGFVGSRIPQQLLAEIYTLARPVIGGVAALAIFAFLVSGLLQVGEIMPGLILALSFAAGFSERLVMSAVETVT